MGAMTRSTAATRYKATNAIKLDANEWAVQVDSSGGQHTLTVFFAGVEKSAADGRIPQP